MKKLILILSVALIGGTVSAQKVNDSDVPANVKTKFASLYPNAKMDKWKNEKGNYQVEFDNNKTEMGATFDAKANLVRTKTKITVAELPKTASDYIEKNYAGKKISEACKMTDAVGTTSYKAEVADQVLMFDSKGSFVKEKNEKDHKKEEHKK